MYQDPKPTGTPNPFRFAKPILLPSVVTGEMYARLAEQWRRSAGPACLWRLNIDPASAEGQELLQEVIVRVFIHYIAKNRPIGNIEALFKTVLRHLVFTHWAECRRWKPLPDELPDLESEQQGKERQEEVEQQLREVMAACTPRVQHVLHLYLQHQDIAATARALLTEAGNMNPSAQELFNTSGLVRVQLHRARLVARRLFGVPPFGEASAAA